MKLRGITLIIISALFYGSYGVWSRLMTGSFGEFSQAWTRGLFLLVVLMISDKIFHIFKPLRKKDLPWLVMIGLAGGLNQAPYFFGFEHLSIGTATTLFYAALVIGGYIIGKFALAERLDAIKIVSLLLSIIGIVMIYTFSLNEKQLLPAAATIAAGLMGSCTVAMTKKVSDYYPEFQIMVGYFAVNVVANGLLSLILRDNLPAVSFSIPWLAQLGYAVSMLIANYAAIEGFKYLEASIASLIGLAEILFGVIFGALFFGEMVTVSTFIGAVIIIFSAALPNIRFTPGVTRGN